MSIGKGDEDRTTSSWQAKIIGVTEPKLKLLVDPLFTKAILNNHSALGDQINLKLNATLHKIINRNITLSLETLK